MHPLTPVVRSWQVFAVVLFFLAQEFGQNAVQGVDAAGSAGSGPGEGFRIGGRMIAGGSVILVAVLLLGVAFVVLSWRMSSFRITDEALELHSGVVVRQQRRARLDRVQAVDVVQPLIARFVGLAKITLEVAGGSDSKIELAFLTETEAQRLRNTLLARAAGVRYDTPEAPAAPERVVLEVPVPRLVGSLALSGMTVTVVLYVMLLPLSLIVLDDLGFLLTTGWAVLPLGGVIWARFARGFGFRVATSPDGLRLRHGLLEQRAQTLPPGRVQAVRLEQPLLWRGTDWWRLRVNVAGYTENTERGQDATSTLLPVGTRAEAMAVLALLLPALGDPGGHRPEEVVGAGLSGTGTALGYVTSPRSARWLDPLAWRRTGFRLTPQALLLRRGVLTRALDVVPHARTQSCGLTQGPLERRLGLVGFALHSTPGPIKPVLPHLAVPVGTWLLAEETERARVARAGAGPERWMERGADRG
jgi:putative membrane protein